MVFPVEADGLEPRAPREPGSPAGGGDGNPPPGGGDPTGGIPIPGRLPPGGQGDKLELLSGRLNQPVPAAYGEHVIGGNIILQHEVTDGADAGKTILFISLGEGEFDRPLFVWVNGLPFDINDTTRFHFHPGIDGQLGNETNPALPNQQRCSFFPSSFNERFSFSRTAYIALKLSPDPTAPGPGFHVVGIYRTKRVRIFDASGNLLRFVYSANPAWVALDLLIRGWIKPFARNVDHAEIETAGNNGAVRASNVVTITTKTPHGLNHSDSVRIDGVADPSFNGTFLVASVPPSPTTFTYNQADVDATSGGGNAYHDDLLIAEQAKIDFAAFIQWATDCDALGFEAHVAFVDQTDLLRALELVLLSGRGYLLEVAGKATPFMDKARSSLLTVAKADIVAGSFRLSQKDARSLANKLQVRFRSLTSGRGPGTISSVGTAVTGTGTEFRNWFKVNSSIQPDSGPQIGQGRVVLAVNSDTSLTIDVPFTADQTGQLYSNPALGFQPSLKELEDLDHQDEIGRTISEEIDLVNTEPEDAERLGEWLLRTTLLLTDQMSCQLQIGQGSLDLLPGDLVTAPSTFEFDPGKTKTWQVLEVADLEDGWREITCQEHSDSIFVDTFGPQQRTAPAQPGDPLEFITTLEGQLSKGLSFGQLSDPFVIKTSVVSGGSIGPGNWVVAIDSIDRNGNHSFSQAVTVNVPPGNDKAIEVDIIPIWGGIGYQTFIGPGPFPSGVYFDHATDRPDGDIIQTGRRIIRVENEQSSGANPQGGGNATEGDLFANFVLNSTIPGGPACFFLNLGQLANSQAAFLFSDYKGICASFQSKSSPDVPGPAGGKTELDIAFEGDSVQLIVAPFDVSKELDVFVNNTLVAIFFGYQFSLFQDLVLAEAAAIGPIGSRKIDLRGLNSSQSDKHVILLQNSSNEFEILVDGVQHLLINSATSKFTVLKHLHVGLDFQHLGAKLGFFGIAAVTKTAVGAGPGAFSGIDNAQAGAVYAQVADLNTLRTAYNSLRNALASYGLV